MHMGPMEHLPTALQLCTPKLGIDLASVQADSVAWLAAGAELSKEGRAELSLHIRRSLYWMKVRS